MALCGEENEREKESFQNKWNCRKRACVSIVHEKGVKIFLSLIQKKTLGVKKLSCKFEQLFIQI